MTLPLLISHLLDPMWVMTIVTVLGAYRSGLHNVMLWRIFVLILIFMVGPVLYLRFMFALEKGSSGWDIRNRAQRPKAIAALLLLCAIYALLAWIFGNPSMGRLFFFYEFWLLGFFLISLVWKISAHSGAIALATGLVMRWFGWTWWPITLFVPLMGWARIVTKNHTIAQVTAGTLYSWLLLIVYETWQSIL